MYDLCGALRSMAAASAETIAVLLRSGGSAASPASVAERE
jgi:hypothetical protein